MAQLSAAGAYDLYKKRGWLLVPGAGIALKDNNRIVLSNCNNPHPLEKRDAEKKNICFDPFLLPLLKWNDPILVTIHVVNEKILIAENVAHEFSLTGHRLLEVLTNWQTGNKFTSEDTVKIPVLENDANNSLVQRVLLKCGLKEPECPGFIVKGRGLFVWGDTVENTVVACDAIVMMIGVILDQRRQSN